MADIKNLGLYQYVFGYTGFDIVPGRVKSGRETVLYSIEKSVLRLCKTPGIFRTRIGMGYRRYKRNEQPRLFYPDGTKGGDGMRTTSNGVVYGVLNCEHFIDEYNYNDFSHKGGYSHRRRLKNAKLPPIEAFIVNRLSFKVTPYGRYYEIGIQPKFCKPGTYEDDTWEANVY